jgi:NAD(P)-dependent dehydrogenase (short-subunit alcohol dehydrogenase family)
VQPEQFRSALAASLESVFLSMRHEIPAMLAAGGGAIVNMASTAGLEAVGGTAGYTAAKHGVVGLTTVGALGRHPSPMKERWHWIEEVERTDDSKR